MDSKEAANSSYPWVVEHAGLRVLNETPLTVTPNPQLMLSVGITLAYDARPPSTVAPLDAQLRTTLGLKL